MNMVNMIGQGKDNYPPHQQGIALVMALGVLSVMIIMAVGFAISMRTERMAAGNYLATVNANHLVRSALHLAMADVHSNLHIVERESCSVAGSSLSVSNASQYLTGDQIAFNNVTWPKTNYPLSAVNLGPTTIDIKDHHGILINMAGRDDEVGGIIKRLANPLGNSYPPWVAKASHSTNIANRPISLTSNALSYIPGSLISEASAVDAAARSNYWINIDAVINGKTTTVGRVAYLIVNCSGLLDANYVGGSPRSSGTNPAEIAIEYLTNEIVNATDFCNARNDYRAAHGSFETLPVLATALAGTPGFTNLWHPENMFCYSAFLENEWVQDRLDVTAGGLVDISGDATNLFNLKTDIIAAFYASGLTNAGEAGIAYTNLVDYVDGDSYAGNEGDGNPKDLYASVEAVPMINEVMFSNTVTVVGTNYLLASTLTVELWYPFNFNNSTPFDFELEANILPDPAWGPTFTPQPLNISISSNITCTPSSFQSLSFTSTNSVSVGPSDPTPSQLIWKETITKATVKYAGQIVDQFDLPLTCVITTPFPGKQQMDKECIDPRFNWDPNSSNQWGPWSTTDSSIDAVNKITQQYWSDHSVNTLQKRTIEVANQRLTGLDELFYLVCSTNPWATIATIDPPLKVYDHFRLESFPVKRGYVNPNTHIINVLAATFYNVPLGSGSTNPPTTRLQAEKIATAIINGKTIFAGKVMGCMTIQEVFDHIWASTVIQNEFDPSEIYALWGNTIKLLNLRQNLFTIIIEVQVASGGNFPRNPASQRAVAVVWRDPFRDNYYVRSLIFF